MPELNAQAFEAALILSDLATLKPEERIAYYKAVCESAGLNPVTKPFEYITLDGKLVLYAGRACTDQLRKLHKISVTDLAKEIIAGTLLYITAKVCMPDGRTDIATGAVALDNLKGDALANAYMKAETKAKRRATLSICGLGLLDESELETISPMAKLPVDSKPLAVPQANVAPTVNQAPAEAVIERNAAAQPDIITGKANGLPMPGPFANTTPPSPEHETTVFPPSMLKPAVPTVPPVPPAPPKQVAAPVIPPAPPTPAPKPVTTPPVVPAPAPAPVSAPPAPPVVPTPVQPTPTPTPAPIGAPPVATSQPTGDAPASPEEYQAFIGQRAARLVRDKLAGTLGKQAGDLMKNYLLKQSGKTKLKDISTAVFERLLKAAEEATPEQAAEIVKGGAQ